MAKYVNLDEVKEIIEYGYENCGGDYFYSLIYDVLDRYAEENKLQMYKDVRIDENGKETVRGYRFGEPWAATALYMEGGYKTETEALKRWYQELQKEGQKNE